VNDFQFKITNSFSLGFAAAAGVKYKLSDNVSLFGELSLLSMSVYIKEAELKSITYNGQSISIPNNIPGAHVKYSKNATVDSNDTEQPRYSQPFSNVGINVGISINLGKHGSRGSSSRNSNDDIDRTKPYRRR